MGSLGERLTEEMNRQGVKVAELSQKTGVNEVTIRRIKAGTVEDPGIMTVAALAKGLGRSVDFLVWEVAPRDPQMAEVIEFFTYRWPSLTEDDKVQINKLLRLMLIRRQVSDLT